MYTLSLHDALPISLCIGCLPVCTRGQLHITGCHKAWRVPCHATGTTTTVAVPAVLAVISPSLF
jgi:hypothetical protein